jgi:hypothetical protein
MYPSVVHEEELKHPEDRIDRIMRSKGIKVR